MDGALEFGLAFFFAGLGTRVLFAEFWPEVRQGFGGSRQRRGLESVFRALQEIEETLAAGVLPEPSRWEMLARLPKPWGSLAFESIMQLRSSGAALVPTLKRLRALASAQLRTLSEARARSSQAVAQAWGCFFLVPVFGAVLFELLPGLEDFPWTWLLLCLGGMALTTIGAYWMICMAENARWAGLPAPSRPWILAAQCAGERFLALVRAGNPADAAWMGACELLALEAPGLALHWGASLWKVSQVSERMPKDPASLILIEAGESLRKAVQLSLMEGRPCAERVEALLAALTHDLQSRVEAELTLLGTRVLKPLFLFVAPAVFLLLGVGFFLCFKSVVGA